MKHRKFALITLAALLGGTAYAADEQSESTDLSVDEAMEQIQDDYSWDKLDADEDGYISYTEAETNQLMTGLWDQFDTDRDKQWSETEYQVFRDWSALDKDRSGDLTEEEAQADPMLSEQWEMLDTDADELLTTEEFAEYNEQEDLLEDEIED